jgi:hypothetical protein
MAALVAGSIFAQPLADKALGAREVPPPAREIPVISAPSEFPHHLLDSVQSAYVTQAGTVDYDKLASDERLGEYVALIAAYSPASHPELFPKRADKLAYWCNAYNALVLYGVVTNWPLESVRDVQVDAWVSAGEGQGFFYALKFQLGGQRMNLYDLENAIIRGFGDPRIHAAINCASLGCPNLDRHAFVAQTQDEHFERLMKGMVAEDRNLRVDHTAKQVVASAIFDWFADDFSDLMVYWIRFADGEKKAALKRARTGGYAISFVEYDWAVNKLGAR